MVSKEDVAKRAQQNRQILLAQVAASQERGKYGSALLLENYKRRNSGKGKV